MDDKTKSKLFVGINLGQHDASCCYLDIEAQNFTIFEEERLSRIKGRGLFPFLSVNRLQNTFIKGKIAAETVSFSSFMTTIQESWKVSQKKKESAYILIDKKYEPTPDSESIIHHEAHLFSALPLLNQFEDHLIVIADGCGSSVDDLKQFSLFSQDQVLEEGFEMISSYTSTKGQLRQIDKKSSLLYWNESKQDTFFPASFFTSAARTVFGDWRHSGKVMGLSAYHSGELYSRKELFDILYNTEDPKKLTPDEFDNLESKVLREKIKICASVQSLFETFMFKYLEGLRQKSKLKSLVLVGGCALNCVFNEKLRKSKMFSEIFIPPWPNDEGISYGTVVGHFYKKYNNFPPLTNKLSPFRGIDFNYQALEIKDIFSKYKVQPLDLEFVATLFCTGEVIGWYEGKSECGPRALGHRSIYADPYQVGIKKHLNSSIKFREAFRPYGCSILKEDQSIYFEDSEGLNSPYMSFAPIVKESKREELREIIHCDKSIRIQTVDELFPSLKNFLLMLKVKRGNSLVIHTSMNINKMPIVNSIHDAKDFFERSNIKFMVFNNYLISKPV